MTSPADGASGNLLPKGTIDQSIGWLLLGIGVILFFLLTVSGMGRVEESSATAVGHSHRATQTEPALDIVGVAPSE